MPIPVTKYRCKFKCGKKSCGDIKAMSAHEIQCWSNPENKTCKTCSNEIYEQDSDDFNHWINRGCKIQSLNDAIEEIQDELKGHNSMHIRPIQMCPYWNKKEDDINALSFIEKINDEIALGKSNGQEKRLHFPYYDFSLKHEQEEREKAKQAFPFFNT